jgi:hypothetical protein
MSPHPYVGLFKKVMSVVGPIFFECGQTLLESAYHNIAFWPNPTPGRTFELPILGSTLTYHVPFSSSTPRIPFSDELLSIFSYVALLEL